MEYFDRFVLKSKLIATNLLKSFEFTIFFNQIRALSHKLVQRQKKLIKIIEKTVKIFKLNTI